MDLENFPLANTTITALMAVVGAASFTLAIDLENISIENYMLLRLCMCARQHSKPQRLFDNVDLLLLLLNRIF